MKHRHHHMHRRNHVPFSFFMFSILFMLFFGWKIFFIVPMLIMFALFSTLLMPRSYAFQTIVVEKPKHKPKNDDAYNGDYI